MEINQDKSAQKTTLGSLKEIAIESSQKLEKEQASEPIENMVVYHQGYHQRSLNRLKIPLKLLNQSKMLKSPKTNR